jgi:hypothetical protein
MRKEPVELLRLPSYALLLVGFILLLVNHISVIMGNPWLIPELLKLH